MWKKPLALLGTSALICTGEMARELSTFRVRRYRMEVPGIERGREIRCLFLSDLHGKEYGTKSFWSRSRRSARTLSWQEATC